MSGFDHPRVPHPTMRLCTTLSDRFAENVAAVFGSMSMFWVLVIWQLAWMVLASVGVWAFASDRYPFPFLLFCSNLIQLWALPILGVATNRADAKRAAKADADHAALTSIHHTVDAILVAVSHGDKPPIDPGVTQSAGDWGPGSPA